MGSHQSSIPSGTASCKRPGSKTENGFKYDNAPVATEPGDQAACLSHGEDHLVVVWKTQCMSNWRSPRQVIDKIKEGIRNGANYDQYGWYADSACTYFDSFLIWPVEDHATWHSWNYANQLVSPCGNCGLSDEKLVALGKLIDAQFKSGGSKDELMYDQYVNAFMEPASVTVSLSSQAYLAACMPETCDWIEPMAATSTEIMAALYGVFGGSLGISAALMIAIGALVDKAVKDDPAGSQPARALA